MTPVLQMALVGLIWAVSMCLVFFTVTACFKWLCGQGGIAGYSGQSDEDEDEFGDNDDSIMLDDSFVFGADSDDDI